MASTIVTGNVLEVKVGSYMGNQVSINVLHFWASTVIGTPTDQDFVDQFEAALFPQYQGVLNALATYYGVQASIIHPLPRQQAVLATAHSGTGPDLADPLPSQVSGICTKRTNLAGRANRGRIYFPFMSEDDNTTGFTPNAAALVKMSVAAIVMCGQHAIANGGNTFTAVPCIWHRATRTYTDIVNFQLRSKWATQRRRGAYGRPNAIPPFGD